MYLPEDSRGYDVTDHTRSQPIDNVSDHHERSISVPDASGPVLQTRRSSRPCTLWNMKKFYATDLSTSEWSYLCGCLPGMPKVVRTQVHALRDVPDAIFHALESDCPRQLFPGDFPPWQTVFYGFRLFRTSSMWHRIFRTLRTAEPARMGRSTDAPAAIMDAQSVKTVEESARISGGDAHKNVRGRERHLLADALGLPLSVSVTAANVQDRVGARCLLSWLRPPVPRLKKCGRMKPAAASLSTKDYERKVQTSATLVELAVVRPIQQRLARQV